MNPTFQTCFDDPCLGNIFSGSTFLASINNNISCIYYTTISQDHKSLELVECLPGVYNRVILVSKEDYTCRNHPDDDVDFSMTAASTLEAFLNGRRRCALSNTRIETGAEPYSSLVKRHTQSCPLMLVKHTFSFGDVFMCVSIILNPEWLCETDDPKMRLGDAVNYAMAFRFDPIDEKQEGKEHE